MAPNTTGLVGLFGDDVLPPGAPAAPPVPAAEPAPLPPPPAETASAESTGAPAEARAGTLRQAWGALRLAGYSARRTWREARNHPGGPIWTIEHFDPPSISAQIAYRDGRGWVQDGYPGGWSEQWGVAYHTWWAIPAMIPAVCWIWLVTRPFRMGGFTLAVAATAAAGWALVHFGVF